MEKTEFRKKLTALVLPITLQQFMLALVSAMDAIMLKLVEQDAMSAVSLATQVPFVENLFLAAITIGLSTLAAQYWGKGDRETVEKLFAYTLRLSVGISLVFFLASLLFPTQLMELLTNEPALIALGAAYLRTVSPAYLLTGFTQIFLCILKNSGRAKLVGAISSAGVVSNVFLNAVLILGLLGFPRMEITGAAIATVLSGLVELVWCTAALYRGSGVKLRFRCLWAKEPALHRSFWRYASPVLGNEIAWGVGFTMYSVIMGHMGSDAVAANSVAGIVKNLACCFCLGLGSGGGILIGNELGAGELERAKQYGGKLCRLCIVSGAALGLAILALNPWLVRFAGLNDQASTYLQGMLAMCSYYMIGKSINSTIISGIFCAGGDSRFGFLCDTVTMWCFSVPLGMAAAFRWKWPVLAVYFLVNMDEMVKLPAVYLHYKKYKWVKNLTVPETEAVIA